MRHYKNSTLTKKEKTPNRNKPDQRVDLARLLMAKKGGYKTSFGQNQQILSSEWRAALAG
jgi:hypothetical protein